MKIKTGFRVGKLTVTGPTSERKKGYTVWECRCDCGNTINLDTRTLQRGAIRDCGCTSVVKPGQRDITGQRFGMLTAIAPVGVDKKAGTVVWHCKCDCGGEVDAPLHQLQSGCRKSCGCLSNPPLKDWVGKRFGKLTVIEYAGRENGMHQWRCKCDCGNTCTVGQTRLLEGTTQSCGCLRESVALENLKLAGGTSVTVLENVLSKVRSNNTSGCTGVYYHKKNNKWVATIRFRGNCYNLGSYTDREDAVKARRRGEEMYTNFIEWYYREYGMPEHKVSVAAVPEAAVVGI